MIFLEFVFVSVFFYYYFEISSLCRLSHPNRKCVFCFYNETRSRFYLSRFCHKVIQFFQLQIFDTFVVWKIFRWTIVICQYEMILQMLHTFSLDGLLLVGCELKFFKSIKIKHLSISVSKSCKTKSILKEKENVYDIIIKLKKVYKKYMFKKL